MLRTSDPGLDLEKGRTSQICCLGSQEVQCTDLGRDLLPFLSSGAVHFLSRKLNLSVGEPHTTAPWWPGLAISYTPCQL